MTRRVGDSIVGELLADSERVELLAWLTEATAEERTLGELPSTPASLALAREMYTAGARKVWAAHLSRYVVPGLDGDVQRVNSGKLVVLLPSDAATRRRFFRWEAKQARSLGLEPRKDEGQEYLFVPLD
jgi:hypothetical protein